MADDDIIDEAERTRQIRRVLSHYDENFTKYLAATIGLTECLPEEINNQVRNAMTHLARAQEATTVGAFNGQIERAISHIDRANRDCLKASIIVAREKLKDLVADAIFYHAALTPEIQTRIANIKEARKEAYRAETQGKNDIVDRLERMLSDILFVSDQIQDHYQESGSKKAPIMRFIYRWSRPFITLLALVIGYILHPITQYLLALIKYYF